jgi:hypothetical protein
MATPIHPIAADRPRAVALANDVQMMVRAVGCAQHGVGESRGETFDQRTLGLGVEGVEISLPEFIHTMRTRLGYQGETNVLKQVRSAILICSSAILSPII